MSSNTTAIPAPSSPPVDTPPSSPAPPASTPAPPPVSSAAPPPPPSSQAPAPSTAPPAQSTPPPASSRPPAQSTRVVTGPSAAPSVEVQTSIVVITPTPSIPGETPSVIVVTSVISPTGDATSNTRSSTPSTTDPTQLQNSAKDSPTGLSPGGRTAIAVVVPVVVVALLVLAGILLWRRRKQRQNAEDERRMEVEEYGYNPNHDPTLPPVGMATEMAEDSSGYRGWGYTNTSSHRKASTTLTSGITYSDSNSNPGGYQSPNSPTQGAYSDANSNDPLMNGRRETLDSDGIGALGAAPTANNQSGVRRGVSNASSSYSAAGRSDTSDNYPSLPMHNPQDYYDQGYYQEGPYGNNNVYSGGQQPVIRDVSARRNTRIENPSIFPQQGNSGIAQNF